MRDPKIGKVYSRRYADVIFDERPKAQDKAPTTTTAHPTDVQIFHVEAADDLSTAISSSREQQNELGDLTANGNSADPYSAPAGLARNEGPAPKAAEDTAPEKAPSAAKKKGHVPKRQESPSPDGFITLQHDRPVSCVADLFDLDPAEYLQYLRDTPGSEGTWMERLKSVKSVIKAGSHVPKPIYEPHTNNTAPLEHAMRAQELDCLKLLWLEELHPYLIARKAKSRPYNKRRCDLAKCRTSDHPISDSLRTTRRSRLAQRDPAPQRLH